MVWNYDECFFLYTQNSKYLLNSLGIAQLDFYMNLPQMLPYQVQIINYLNNKLIQLRY